MEKNSRTTLHYVMQFYNAWVHVILSYTPWCGTNHLALPILILCARTEKRVSLMKMKHSVKTSARFSDLKSWYQSFRLCRSQLRSNCFNCVQVWKYWRRPPSTLHIIVYCVSIVDYHFKHTFILWWCFPGFPYSIQVLIKCSGAFFLFSMHR